jgi:hypothetical protein
MQTAVPDGLLENAFSSIFYIEIYEQNFHLICGEPIPMHEKYL